MLRRQQHLAGRIAGYHRLARWVALRQPLSLAAPRIARPPMLVPLAAPPEGEADTHPWQPAVEDAPPSAGVSFGLARGAANVAPEGAAAWPILPAEPAIEPTTVAPAARDILPGAREGDDPRATTEVAPLVARTRPVSASPAERIAAADVAPAAPPLSAVSAVPRDVPAADEAGREVLTATAEGSVARAASDTDTDRVTQDEATGLPRVVTTEAATGVDADRVAQSEETAGVAAVDRAAAPAQQPLTAPTPPLVPRDDDADMAGLGRVVPVADAVGAAAASPLFAGEDRVLGSEQRRDDRPPVQDVTPPPGEPRTPPGAPGEDTPIATVGESTVPTTAAPAEASDTVSATPATTVGASDVEIVRPRRPRPQTLVPASRASATRIPGREADLADAARDETVAAVGQPTVDVPAAIANESARADDSARPLATGEPMSAVPPADDPEELFAPRQSDRSPASWIARLTGRAVEAPQPPDPASQTATGSPTVAATAPPVPDQTQDRQMASAMPLSVRAQPPTPAADRSVASPQLASADAEARSVAPRAPAVSPAAASTPAAPTPLPDATRRFLQPLVGIDPASVRIYSDPAATQLAARARADALAVGDVVALGAGHQPGAGTPETLGLLAHELTHVARAREPRFVPPITRTAGSPTGAETDAAPTGEEALARTVEARVRRAATAAPIAERPPSALAVATPRRAAPSPGAPERAEPADAATDAIVAGAARGPLVVGGDTAWDGLPAPWEPLPNWLDTPAPYAAPPLYAAPSTYAAPLAVASPVAADFAAQGAAAPAVQLAEQGRAVDTGADGATASAEQHAAKPPEPDLDALARQVYAVLRRRLAVEGRRAW